MRSINVLQKTGQSNAILCYIHGNDEMQIWVSSSRDLHRFCSAWSSKLTSSPFVLRRRTHLNLSTEWQFFAEALPLLH
jgi:hypothetical protein